MSRRLYLVRHAMPVVDPDTVSTQWRLDAAGEASAAELTRSLPDGGIHWTASTEAKAWQTAEAMAAIRGGEVYRDAGFAEIHRPFVFTPNHRQLASSYVAGTVHPGWEPHADVVARFDAAVRRQLDRAGGRHVVVATHGMALTLWLASRIDVGDPAQFWRGLALPDIIAVDPAADIPAS